MSNDLNPVNNTVILDWLASNMDIVKKFREIISEAPEDIDWGSDTDFENRWARLVKETEKTISLEFPQTSKDQLVEVVRMFAQKVS